MLEEPLTSQQGGESNTDVAWCTEHELTTVHTVPRGEEDWFCSGCQKQMSPGVMLRSCEECNFDLCPTCHSQFSSISARRMEKGLPELSNSDVLTRRFTRAVGAVVKKGTISDGNRKFKNNIQVAFFTALWVSIFGIPMYMDFAHIFIFGSVDLAQDVPELNRTDPEVELCGPAQLGYQFSNVSEDNTSFTMQDWDHQGSWTGDFPQVWCGYVPQSYIAYWPNVVQMVIFTVYFNTGSTIQLAWQGIAGTTCAVINIKIMERLFPYGGKAHICNAADVAASFQAFAVNSQTCTSVGEWVYNDPAYNASVVWINILGLIFLFLVSSAKENSIKFGMSWHIYFMMNFLNPATGVSQGHFQSGIPFLGAYDSERIVVWMTSIIGATIAICATLVPRPVSLYRKVIVDSRVIVDRVDKLWDLSIDYFSGCQRSDKVMQIATGINKFGALAASAEEDLAMSWWETFDINSLGCLGKSAEVRQMYKEFDHAVTNSTVRNLFYAVEIAILDEDFAGKHMDFVKHMKVPMMQLKRCTVQLLDQCQKACEDGDISPEEKHRIRRNVLECDEAQEELAAAFRQVCVTVNQDFTQEYIFIYALSYWARKMCIFAQDIEDPESMETCFDTFRNHAKTGLLATFNLKATFQDWDKVSFALRNWISITICFTIAFNVHSSVFAPGYSPSAASTIALLISHFSGSALNKNLHRLLGVSLGKVLPIIVLAMMSNLPCGLPRYMSQFAMIFMYIFFACYVYYASKQWSLVGCLCAGFGCYPLLSYQTCHDTDMTSTFLANYKELGQVVTAIIVQFLVDLAFKSKKPRELATDAISDVGKEVIKAYDCFFALDFPGMKTARANASAKLDQCLALVLEADPKMDLVPGRRIEFKHDLYVEAVGSFKLIVSDLSMLILAGESFEAMMQSEGRNAKRRTSVQVVPSLLGSPTQRLLQLLFTNVEHMKTVEKDVKAMLSQTSRVLDAMLRHPDETPMQGGDIDDIIAQVGAQGLAHLDGLFEELHAKDAMFAWQDKCQLTEDFRVRTSVIVQSLENLMQHMIAIRKSVIKVNPLL